MDEDPDDEENTDYAQIDSYSLQLPTVQQLMAQKSLPHGTPSEQTRDKKIASSGKFAMAVMRSPKATRDHTMEKENQHKEGIRCRTIFGSYNNENGDLPYIHPEELLKATIKH